MSHSSMDTPVSDRNSVTPSPSLMMEPCRSLTPKSPRSQGHSTLISTSMLSPVNQHTASPIKVSPQKDDLRVSPQQNHMASEFITSNFSPNARISSAVQGSPLLQSPSVTRSVQIIQSPQSSSSAILYPKVELTDSTDTISSEENTMPAPAPQLNTPSGSTNSGKVANEVEKLISIVSSNPLPQGQQQHTGM